MRSKRATVTRRAIASPARLPRLDRDKLAAVVAELDEGTAPSTIGRKVGVGYATVARIAETTKRLQRAGIG